MSTFTESLRRTGRDDCITAADHLEQYAKEIAALRQKEQSATSRANTATTKLDTILATIQPQAWAELDRARGAIEQIILTESGTK